MIGKLFYLFFPLFLLGNVLFASPQIEVSLESLEHPAYQPIQVTLTITHSQSEKIDPTSFKMNSKNLTVNFVQDVKIGDEILSIYHFELPPQESGLYILPKIQVEVDQQVYSTIPSTYQVKKEEKPTRSHSIELNQTPPLSPPTLLLEAQIIGKSELFPGQRTKFLYRISFNHHIDLTQSILPLVHPPHFKKVGDVQIKESQKGELTIQELTQEVEAEEIGIFDLGPSRIEGYAYSLINGKKQRFSPLLKSEVPIVRIEVKAFASQSPLSFTNGLGKIAAKLILNNHTLVNVGETLKVYLEVTDLTNLSEFQLPNFACQPAIAGFFQLNDNPSLVNLQENRRLFELDLRILSHQTTEIPPLEFTSFDPDKQAYVTIHTEPISFTLSSNTLQNEDMISKSQVEDFLPSKMNWTFPTLVPIQEIGRMTVSKHSLALWWMLFFLSLLGLFYSMYLSKWKRKVTTQTLLKSQQFFQQAVKSPPHSLQQIHLLEEAMWNYVWEKKILDENDKRLESVLVVCPKSYQILFQLQELHYTSRSKLELQSFINDIKNYLLKS